MRLLFDRNLSPKLPGRLNDLFPGSDHVLALGMDQADDRDIWEIARSEGFAIVTKDSDLNDVALLRGSPPKLVWLRIGNCTVRQSEQILRDHVDEIRALADDSECGILVLT